MQDAPQATNQAADLQQPTGEVCCALGGETQTDSQTVISQRSRCARAIVGAGFLAVAGALATRRTPGGIALWPVALVPAWFGICILWPPDRLPRMPRTRGYPQRVLRSNGHHTVSTLAKSRPPARPVPPLEKAIDILR